MTIPGGAGGGGRTTFGVCCAGRVDAVGDVFDVGCGRCGCFTGASGADCGAGMNVSETTTDGIGGLALAGIVVVVVLTLGSVVVVVVVTGKPSALLTEPSK